MPDLGCWGGEIVGKDEDGYIPRIVFLKCTNCGKTGWHTKNIGYIGARTIYNHKGGCEEMQKLITCFPECTCDFSHLKVDKDLLNHVKNCERCRKYGF